MSGSAPLTIRLDTDLSARLRALAAETKREPDALVAEAVAAYLDWDAAELAALDEALAQADRGEVIPHEQVMAEIRQIINRAQ